MKSDNILNIRNERIGKEIDASTFIREKQIVITGNPNVGKSLFFNHMSGLYVDVSNYPGSTVSVSQAPYKEYTLFDTPGIYGISSFNEEERVARDMILSGDIILNVVNALHLERDLFLTLQLIEMGKKMTVFLNFSDELEKKRIKIDREKLSELLGVEVILSSAVNKSGFDKIDHAIENARVGRQHLEQHFILHEIIRKTGSQAEALLIMEGDTDISASRGMPPGSADEREYVYINRRNRVNELVDIIEYEDSRKGELFNKIGRLSLNPLTGIPILGVVLFLIYLFIGDLISQRVVDFTENKIGKGIFEYYTKTFVGNFTGVDINVEGFDESENTIYERTFSFPEGIDSDPVLEAEMLKELDSYDHETNFKFHNPFFQLFFGEFGVITMTVTYLLFLLLPLVIGFYLVMAALEDSGYLPRLATMLDRSLNKIGLNGKAVIPIMLGFGCVTAANITSRILGTERERSIVTAILQFVIPCSAQLAVIAALLSGAGLMPLLIYGTAIFSVLIILSTVLNKMLPGTSSPLLIDLPAIRIPKIGNIIKKMTFRSYGFMKEAGLWFFVGALAVGLMQISGLLEIWKDLLAPLTESWLRLPKEASTAFVMGIVRRDFGAAGLFALDLNEMQITVAIITITLFVPCIASFVVMLKERGWKEGVSIWIGTWITAFLVGGLVAGIIL